MVNKLQCHILSCLPNSSVNLIEFTTTDQIDRLHGKQWILISWPLKLADQDLHCFQERIYLGSAGLGLELSIPLY